MKKILIALTLVLSCLGINSVKAEDLQLTIDSYYDEYKSEVGEDNLNNILNEVLDEYKNTYIVSYPYYFIQIQFWSPDSYGFESTGYLDVSLNYFDEFPIFEWVASLSPGVGVSTMWLESVNESGVIGRRYSVIRDYQNVFDNSYTTFSIDTSIIMLDYNNNPKYYKYYPSHYYISNFNLYMPSLNSVKEYSNSGFIYEYDNILIPKLDGSNLSSVVSLEREDYLIEPYYLYDSDVEVTLPDYTEINLNDYAYVALALKDYNQDPFETTVQVKGQYCITPVYDHGLKTYDSVVGTKVQNVCSPYYSDYTPVRTTITSDNINNHAIYYVKSYNTEQDNYIKVDNTIFDITYISEEEASNPYVIVNGKSYPTIPYDDLPSSATQNTEEGYIPGQVEEFTFADIFTAPLNFLEDVWDSIVLVFDLIKELISLLPVQMQNFLLFSFMLSVVIGLLKMLL